MREERDRVADHLLTDCSIALTERAGLLTRERFKRSIDPIFDLSITGETEE
ncbi:hypothetical protein ACNS7O_15740 (plasmid) [Haloferacaceae archaeon DSL9]